LKQHLHVFVEVVERKNFSRAAEELYMTQPAVSQYIRALEETMGVRLLDRTNKSVELNKAGEIVYHHAKEVLSIYTRMDHLLSELTEKAQGPLAIGASYTYGEYVLPKVLATMKKKYPDIEPTVTIGNTTTIAERVSGYDLDIGIVEGHFKDESLIKEKIAEDELVLIASPDHPLASKPYVSLKELEKETWIIREEGSGTREAADKLFQENHLSIKDKFIFSSTQLIKEAVGEGMGISFLSKWAIRKDVQHGTLAILQTDAPLLKRDFSTIIKSPFQSKALKVFLELL